MNNKSQNLFERLILKFNLCDGCLGRQLSILAPGLEQWQVGRSLKTAAFLSAAICLEQNGFRGRLGTMRALAGSGFAPAVSYLREKHNIEMRAEPCYICGSDIERLMDATAQKVEEKLRGIEFRTFKTGSSFPTSVISREDEVKQKLKIPWGESIKAFVNSYLDRRVSRLMNVTSDAEEPDVVVVVKPLVGEVSLSLLPLYVKGRYRKHERGISQTRKRGKDPLSSLEGMLASVIVPESGATDVKFHGAGREDVDALMLGPGRPFVIEVVNPTKRSLELAAIQNKINETYSGRIEVVDFKRATRKDVLNVKVLGERVNKVYKATVRFGRDVSEGELKELEKKMEGLQINQRTPSRVAWRRADKVRRKTIVSAKFNKLAENSATAVFVAQGGTYIKEAVSGDLRRTKPSLSELLNTTAECVDLEVIGFLGEA